MKIEAESGPSNQIRKWMRVELELKFNDEDLGCWLFMQQGALGCEVIAVDSEKCLIQASFERSVCDGAFAPGLLAALDEYGLSYSAKTLKYAEIEEEDWLSKWREGFEPFDVGSIFRVCPVWSFDGDYVCDGNRRQVIVIDPGMAFGTGLHPTTRFCLVAIEKVLHLDIFTPLDEASADVLDVGTGSGILAAALTRSHPSTKVVAIDNDPVAIANAEKTLVLNKIESRVELICGTTEDLGARRFSLILSNMTAEDNVALLPEYLRFLYPGGVVVLAGILDEKSLYVESALQEFDFKIIDRQVDGMWIGLIAQVQH